MIEIKNLHHEFILGKRDKQRRIPILHDINLQIKEKEIVAILGRSGSGKSTLLNLISGYLRPTKGTILINDQLVSDFNEGQWADFRLNNLGFIFQSFQLIEKMTAFANAELPLVLQGVPAPQRKKRVTTLFEQLGMDAFINHYPSELSGGQQQRVSVARALMLNPRIVLADEPTGSLDTENEHQLLSLIQELNQDLGITFVMITHDDQVAATAHRTLKLQNGCLLEMKKDYNLLQKGALLHEVR